MSDIGKLRSLFDGLKSVLINRACNYNKDKAQLLIKYLKSINTTQVVWFRIDKSS